MLTKIADPRSNGIKLILDETREIFVSITGWRVTPYIDDDGNEYEFTTRTRPDGVIKSQWFRVDD